MYSAFPGNCSVSYLSFACGRSLWAEPKVGKNSLYWKANMLPLFSIMTLWIGLSAITLRCYRGLLELRFRGYQGDEV